MIGTDTIKMALAGLMIVVCFIVILMDLYLAIGTIFPELIIRIDQKIRKALKKPSIIILDPWYIRKKNFTWFIWIVVLFHMTVFAFVFIIKLIG